MWLSYRLFFVWLVGCLISNSGRKGSSYSILSFWSQMAWYLVFWLSVLLLLCLIVDWVWVCSMAFCCFLWWYNGSFQVVCSSTCSTLIMQQHLSYSYACFSTHTHRFISASCSLISVARLTVISIYTRTGTSKGLSSSGVTCLRGNSKVSKNQSNNPILYHHHYKVRFICSWHQLHFLSFYGCWIIWLRATEGTRRHCAIAKERGRNQ